MAGFAHLSSLVSFVDGVDSEEGGEAARARRYCLQLHCGGRGRVSTESVLQLILPMLDDATKVTLSEVWPEQMLAANETSLLRACKVLVLGQEQPQQQQRVLALATSFAACEGTGSQTNSQWGQLVTVIADKMRHKEAEDAARHKEALDSLGPLLLLSPTFVQGGKVRMMHASVLRACLEAEAPECPALADLASACLGGDAAAQAGANTAEVVGDKRKGTSASSSVHDFLDRAFRFCCHSSGTSSECRDDDDGEWRRCCALGRVLRRVAAEDVATARAVVYRLGSELTLLFEGQEQDRSQLYAFATFLTITASSMMVAGASADAADSPQSPPPCKRSKARGQGCAEGDVLRAELHELLGWAVGRLWCALCQAPEAVPRNLPRALSLASQAAGTSPHLPTGLLESVDFLLRNASGEPTAGEVAQSSALHLPAASRLYPSVAGRMACIAALGRPRLIHASHSILRYTSALLQEASGRINDETTAFRLLLLVQALKPLSVAYPMLLCRIVTEAAALALRAGGGEENADEEVDVLMAVLPFLSNLVCFGETRVPLDHLLDACTPASAGDGGECSHDLQSAVFLMASRPGSGDEHDAAAWLRRELAHRPHGVMALLHACAELIGQRAGRAGLVDADVVQGVRQAVASALAGLPSEGAGSVGESFRAALACFCDYIGPFFQARAAATVRSSTASKSNFTSSSSISSVGDAGPQPSDVLWQTVEAQQWQVQQQWPEGGEAALMSLFGAVSTARGLTLAMPLPGLPWVLSQTLNCVACEAFWARDEVLCRAARRFVGEPSVLAALLQAHGHEHAPLRSTGGQVLPTPPIVPLLLSPMETFLFPALPLASVLARPSPLQLDLLLSAGPARRGDALTLHSSSLSCEDWTSLTFAAIHAVRAGVRERSLLEEPGRGESVVETAMVAVVRAHSAKIVLPALGHALQWHLLRLALYTQPSHLAESLGYCVACVEVVAACLSPRSLGLLLAGVLDAPTLGACYRCIVLARGTDRSAGGQHLQVALVHLLSALERSCCGHGQPGLDSESLPLQRGVLSLLSLGYLALGMDSAAAGVRARLLASLARLAPLLAAAVVSRAQHSVSGMEGQGQSAVGFLVQCGGRVYALTLSPDDGSVLVSGSSGGNVDDGGAFLSDVMLLGAPEGLGQAVLLPRLEMIWAALLWTSEPPGACLEFAASRSAHLVAELERGSGAATVPTAAWTGAEASPHPALAAATHPSLGCLLTCVIMPWQRQLQQQHQDEASLQAGAWSMLLHRLMTHRCAAASRAEEPRAASTLADLALSYACSNACGEVLLVALQAAAQARVPAQATVALKLLLCLPRGLAWARTGPNAGAADCARRGVGDLSALLATWAGSGPGGEVASACPWAWGLLTDLLCEVTWLVVSAEASALFSSGRRGEEGEGLEGGEGGEDREHEARRCLGMLQGQGSGFVSAFQRCVQALSGAQCEAGAFESRVRAACCGWRCGPAPEALRERRSLGAAIVLQTRALAPALGSAAVHIPTLSSSSSNISSSSSQGAISTPLSCSPVKATTPQSPRSPGARGLGLAALLHARCRPLAPAHAHTHTDADAAASDSGYGVGGEAIREFIAAYYPHELQASGREQRGDLGRELGEALVTVPAADVSVEPCPPPPPSPLPEEESKVASRGRGKGKGRGRGKETEAPSEAPAAIPEPPPPVAEADGAAAAAAAAAASADTWAAGDITKKFGGW